MRNINPFKKPLMGWALVLVIIGIILVVNKQSRMDSRGSSKEKRQTAQVAIAPPSLINLTINSVAASAMVTWNASTDVNCIGYTLHHGPTPRNLACTNKHNCYAQHILVGPSANPMVSVTVPLGTTYFAVSQRHAGGLESNYSNEVVVIVAVPSPSPVPTSTPPKTPSPSPAPTATPGVPTPSPVPTPGRTPQPGATAEPGPCLPCPVDTPCPKR